LEDYEPSWTAISVETSENEEKLFLAQFKLEKRSGPDTLGGKQRTSVPPKSRARKNI